MNPMFLVFTSVMLNAAAQMLLKIGMQRIGHFDISMSNLLSVSMQVATSMSIISGMACYVISILIWLVVLSRMDVSAAYPLSSLGYVVTSLAAYALLNEPLGAMRIAGIFVILGGVWMVSRTA